MDKSQQQATGIAYKFSIYQIEYSRNLLFKRGRQMDDVYQKIIDLTRRRLDIKRLKTIFGKKNRPYNHRYSAPAPQVRIETPDYNLTVFKIQFGRLTVKLYDKGERTLRAEVVVHNTKDLKCKRGIEFFKEVVDKLETIMNSFLSNLNYAHVATIDEQTIEQIATPTQAGNNRLAGINIQQSRMKQVAYALLYLAMKPGGFTSMNLALQINERGNLNYSRRNAAYDLRKFRGKLMVEKVKGRIKYVLTEQGIKTLVVLLSLTTHQIPALMSVIGKTSINTNTQQLAKVDVHLFNIRKEVELIREIQGMRIAA